MHIGFIAGRDEHKSVNPKLGVAYLASDNIKLRASAGSSFRAPRITATYYPTFTTLPHLHYKSNLDLKEETIISYEAGVDYRTSDDRLTASLTAFFVDAKDRIDLTFLGGFTADDPFIITHRNLSAKIPGVEGGLGYTISQNLSVAGNVSFVSPEYNGGPFDGKVTPEVPDHTVNVHADFQAMQELALRLSLQRVGEINDNASNTVLLDPYNLLNLKARYDLALDSHRSYYLDAALTNLLDEDYQIPHSGEASLDFQPLGRALHLGVGYSF